MNDREIEISAFTLAQRYEHEFNMSLDLPVLRPDRLGFAYLKDYGGKRDELILAFSKFTVNHNNETGCKTRAVDGRVNLKGKKAPVVEVAWEIFRPSQCNDVAKNPGHICSTRGCFAFIHSQMMGPEEMVAHEVCRKKKVCECSGIKCILERE